MIHKAGTEGFVDKGFNLLRADSASISCDSLKTAVGNSGLDITENQVRFMIAEADTDGDGRISKDEFINILLSCVYDNLFLKPFLAVPNVLEQWFPCEQPLWSCHQLFLVWIVRSSNSLAIWRFW
jgi:hypothetical protein